MSLTECAKPSTPRRFPRVSGDEPQLSKQLTKSIKFSPRERG